MNNVERAHYLFALYPQFIAVHIHNLYEWCTQMLLKPPEEKLCSHLPNDRYRMACNGIKQVIEMYDMINVTPSPADIASQMFHHLDYCHINHFVLKNITRRAHTGNRLEQQFYKAVQLFYLS